METSMLHQGMERNFCNAKHLRSAEGTGDFEAFGLRKDRSPSASLAPATSRIDESLRGALRKILFSHGFSPTAGRTKNA